MKNKQPSNISASVFARLKNIADKSNLNFQTLLFRYVIERFLYRLSVSPHARIFTLKGASLFTLWLGPSYRETRDADFLCQGDSTPENLINIVRDIIQIECNDGVDFKSDSITASEIRKGLEYGGTCISITAYIENAKIPVQFDIGFSDCVHPRAKLTAYPTFLDMPQPRLKVYPKETVIAEKYDAIVTLDMANSRLKDFYDLWLLSTQFDFEYDLLNEAVLKTFQRRKHTLPNALPAGLSDQFALSAQKQSQWRAFCKKVRPKDAPEDLRVVIQQIECFLHPIVFQTTPPPTTWKHGEGWI